MEKNNKKLNLDIIELKANNPREFEEAKKKIKELGIEELKNQFDVYNNAKYEEINMLAAINKDNNELAGTLSFRVFSDYIYVIYLSTEKTSPTLQNYEGKGVASRLLEELRCYAKKHNIPRIELLSVSERSSGTYWKNGYIADQGPEDGKSKAHLDMVNYVNKKDVAVAGVLYHAFQKAKRNNTTINEEIDNLLNEKVFDKIQQYVNKTKNNDRITEDQLKTILNKPDVRKYLNSDLSEILQYSLTKETGKPAHDFVKSMGFVIKSVKGCKSFNELKEGMQEFLNNKKAFNYIILDKYLLKRCPELISKKSNSSTRNILNIIKSIDKEEQTLKDENLNEKFLRHGKHYLINFDYEYLNKIANPNNLDHRDYVQMTKIFKDCFPQYEINLTQVLPSKGEILCLEDKNLDVLGFVIINKIFDAKKIKIEYLCVDKNQRENGVGTFLLKQVEKIAENLNLETVEASALVDSMGVYYKNNFLIKENEHTPSINKIKKYVNKDFRQKGEICYEILKTMKQFKLNDVKEYIDMIVENQEYDNIYQYDITQQQINNYLVSDKQMPRLMAIMQDMIDYKIKPNQIVNFVNNINEDKYKSSKYRAMFGDDYKLKNIFYKEEDNHVFNIMSNIYNDDIIHGHNMFKDYKNIENSDINNLIER